MVDILLVVVLVAALGGMLVCGRDHKRRPGLQLIALLLLVLVIASGGMFMCRRGALSMLGFEVGNEQHLNIDAKLRESQGYAIANFIKNSYPDNKKVLLIANRDDTAFSQALLGQLRDSGVGTLVRENLEHEAQGGAGDNLITPGAAQLSEARAIEAAIAKHPDAGVIIISGIAPSGESLGRLSLYRMPNSTRPKLVILGVSNLIEWFAEQIDRGMISAMVVTDLTKTFHTDQVLPENPLEVFNTRYVLITKDNLQRNRRFFR